MKNVYYRWLISQVCDKSYDSRYYSKLLFDLFNIDFTWTIPLDENRELGGLKLREEYPYNGMAKDQPCSMLEMMVALSLRVEREYLREGERIIFFWDMIKSLGLYGNDDYNYDSDLTDAVISNLLGHTYRADGKGGLFKLQNPPDDMRDVQIWQQAMWYISEVYDERWHLE